LVVGAVVGAAVGYVALSVVAQCGEVRTCSSSRAATRLETRKPKTARLDARWHA
jgi:hypothetical protein